MRRITALVLIIALMWISAAQVLAQEVEPAQLILSTRYPAQVVEAGQRVTLNFTLRNNGPQPQTVRLDVNGVPEGWEASFRGGGRIIKAVYVVPDKDVSFDLRLEQPKDVEPGTYRLTVVARGEGARAEMPIELTVQEKLPPRLTLDVELPKLRGTRSTNFRFEGTLKNEGDEDLTVNLEAQAPQGFQVVFRPSFGSQEVTSLPVKADESKRLNIEVRVPRQIQAGEYPIRVRAVGGDAEATIDLAVEITGQADLTVTAPEGRLSTQAYVGQETPLEILVQNLGTASARNVEMSATSPSGWKVEFDPKRIDEIAPGEQAQVTARLRPSDKAVAGDYMVTVRASAEGGISDSTDFRITVLTSTLWGIVGVALIAVAVAVVGLAVMRFGRR